MGTIRIDRELMDVLLRVAKPGRYTGGEYGSVVKEGSDLLRVAISYPDLYEIGMSNLAVRILYRLLNSLPGVYCERVFAPAPDFEAELRSRGLPLFSLETGRPLREFDLIGFSIGYELTLTNLLAILDTGGVSLFSRDRGPGEPIVIAGGPAVTNPLPFGRFVDAVFIGEAESWAAEVFPRLAGQKRRGASRADLLAALRDHPSVWHAGKTGRTRRAVWRGFGDNGIADDCGANGGAAAPAALTAHPSRAAFPGVPAPFPVASIKTVQDQGVVEIMRGCPNGCRFCHAGILYRPFRLREPAAILRHTDELVHGCGYREVTLSSLSSADYPGIDRLVDLLNRRYRDQRVSFSLPSLRIGSMNMDLMACLSEVRKSGLTFAVETPLPEWQRGLNKEATLERTVALLQEARQKGWRQAKFYFMIGLPVSGGADESGPIVDFLEQVQRETRLNLNVNVACFIPKPHTPFQWASQLTEQVGLERIMAIKRGLARSRVKVGYHAPFLSFLEGVVSRGDERAGDLVLQAFRRGARLDAWEEHVNWDLWRDVFRDAGWDVEGETCRERGLEEKLPWDGIDLGVADRYLRAEMARARRGELTGACQSDCGAPCGACGRDGKVKDRVAEPAPPEAPPGAGASAVADSSLPAGETTPGAARRLLFSFAKEGRAIYLSHLNVMGIFERALARAGFQALFTEGFNPKPRLEFASPLPLGVASEGEVASVDLAGADDPAGFAERMNLVLPEGIRVLRAQEIGIPAAGQKKHSLMSRFWGADYRVEAAGGEREGALQALREKLDAAAGTAAGARTGEPVLSRVRLDPGSLAFRLRQTDAEGAGILRFLKETAGIELPAAGLRLLREGVLARGQGDEPASHLS